jgi:hypothetical protein
MRKDIEEMPLETVPLVDRPIKLQLLIKEAFDDGRINLEQWMVDILGEDKCFKTRVELAKFLNVSDTVVSKGNIARSRATGRAKLSLPLIIFTINFLVKKGWFEDYLVRLNAAGSVYRIDSFEIMLDLLSDFVASLLPKGVPKNRATVRVAALLFLNPATLSANRVEKKLTQVTVLIKLLSFIFLEKGGYQEYMTYLAEDVLGTAMNSSSNQVHQA